MRFEIEFPTSALSAGDEAAFAAARTVAEPAQGPESAAPAGGLRGTLREGRHVGRGVYPTVARDWWVYVPAGGGGGAPANLVVFQDGNNYLKRASAAAVLDNLIAAGDLKPTVGVFIEPGDVDGHAHGSRTNRSLEYDHVSDAYVRFLTGELLPDIAGDLKITDDPRGRAICGMSSGGICAFNAAWERPDAFGRVISHVGSFTNIRGGHVYPSRVRQNGAKPLRVFLQGGAGDLDNANGHWPTANIDMAAALRFKGYDMRFEFGVGGHNFFHAAAILPQTLRWIFRA